LKSGQFGGTAKARRTIRFLVQFVDFNAIFHRLVNDESFGIRTPLNVGGVIKLNVDSQTFMVLVGKIFARPNENCPVCKKFFNYT